MVKAEVVFDGNIVMCNGHEIHIIDDGTCEIITKQGESLSDWILGDAVKWCLENSDEQ